MDFGTFVQFLTYMCQIYVFFCFSIKAKCVALITDNQGRRNGNSIDLKKIADEAIKLCPTIRITFVIDRTDETYETSEIVINLRKVFLDIRVSLFFFSKFIFVFNFGKQENARISEFM
jgi:hypothetical protein